MCPQDYRGILIGVTFVVEGEIEPYITDIDCVAFPQLNTINAVVVNETPFSESRSFKVSAPSSFWRISACSRETE